MQQKTLKGKLLSTLRKGEYEGLEARLTNKDEIHSDATRLPDFGPKTWTEEAKKSGGITIGARDILIAYNVNVEEIDAVVAKKIGSIIRGSGRLIKQSNGKKMRDKRYDSRNSRYGSNTRISFN